jgi:hypothetical protein
MIYTIPTVKELREATELGNHKFNVISFFESVDSSSNTCDPLAYASPSIFALLSDTDQLSNFMP